MKKKLEEIILLHESGKLPQPSSGYLKPIFGTDKVSDIYNMLGIVLCQGSDYHAACIHFERAIKMQPGIAAYHANLGVARKRCGDAAAAETAYRRAIEIDNTCVSALSNLANHLIARGDTVGASELLMSATNVPVKDFNEDNLKATIQGLISLKLYAQALDFLDGFIRNSEGDFLPLAEYGAVLYFLGRYQDSADWSKRALAISPKNRFVQYNLAVALHADKQIDQAIDEYRKVLILDPTHKEALSNLGVIFHKRNHYQEAQQLLEKARDVDPEYVDARINLGVLYKDMKRFSDAEKVLKEALTINEKSVTARLNLAITYLTQGKYVDGWREYESRWDDEQLKPELREFSSVLWDGRQDIFGKKIFIYAEQGFGDSIQFIRYIDKVVELGARVTIELPVQLISIYKNLKGVYEIVPRKNSLKDQFDYHCPLLSLPRIFGTRIGTIPRRTPPISLSPEVLSRWSTRLAKLRRPLIGICWSGRATHNNNYNRSIPLKDFLSIFESFDLDLIVLQKEVAEEDYILLQSKDRIHNFCNEIHSFADTAALCASVDLIISVDTSVAHLSASIGRRTYVLLPYNPDFRWLTGRIDSPWYPSVRLFRQNAPGDWAGAFADLKRTILLWLRKAG